jgi:hypothetical protein
VSGVGAHLRKRGAAVALVGLLGIAVLAACGDPAGKNTGQPDTDTTAEQGLGNTDNSGTGNTGNGGNPSGGATRTASPRPSTSRTPSLPPGPTIEYFRVKQARMCPSLSAPNPLSKELILEWKVTGGATSIKLYLDGDTFYSNAPTTDTPTVAFACSSTPGKTATHVYELKTVGGGAERTAKLTLSAQTPP